MAVAGAPVMIVATEILRAPRARVGKLFGNVTLPRSVELRSVGAGGAGAVVGLFLWIMPIGIFTRYSITSLIYTMLIFGAAGVGTLYLQPLKGEPLWRWMFLMLKGASAKRRGAGTVYLGVHRLERVAAGRMRLAASCVDVPAGSFDGRGSPRKHDVIDRESSMQEAAEQGFRPARRLG